MDEQDPSLDSESELVDESESTDVTRVTVGEHEYIIIGTAHISQQSVDIVKRTIAQEQPDFVAVELDEGRYRALMNPDSWQDLNLLDVIKKRQTTFLVARLALMAFQKKMSLYTGVKPGAEMMAAIEIADEIDSELLLIDRDIQITLRRAWRTTPFWKRSSVAVLMVGGMFQKSEVSEDELEQLREDHNITAILDELGEALPEVKSVLVDERDIYMANKTKELTSVDNPQKTVIVIGAAHKPGYIRHLKAKEQAMSESELTHVPKPSPFSKALPWILPAIVISMFAVGFYRGNYEEFKTAALAWLLVNGTLAAVGAALALGHPLTVLVAFISAPFTSLNPTIGVGMVTGFTQAIVAAPTVRDMESVGDDVTHWTGIWKNRLSRVLLVFILSNLGSMIGTFVSFKWLTDLL